MIPATFPLPDRDECLLRNHGVCSAVTRDEVAAHLGACPDGILAAGKRADGALILVFEDEPGIWDVSSITGEEFTAALAVFALNELRREQAAERLAA